MYCHPSQVSKWAKAIKPKATPQQLELARIMRSAKIAKRIFQERQISIFEGSSDGI